MQRSETWIRRVSTGLARIAILGCLAGCAASTPLTKQARESIKSVTINRDVVMPKGMTYIGQSQAVSATLLGPLGAGIAAAAAQGPAAQLIIAMQESGIDVREIVREQLSAGLKAGGLFPLLNSDPADADFKLEIRQYGFVHAPFSTALRPILGVNAKLVRPDGTVVWEKYDQVWTANGETPARQLAEYLDTPPRIQDALSVAAKLVVGTFVKDLGVP
jgi:hypothetical protein